jgi:FemAB family protein
MNIITPPLPKFGEYYTAFHREQAESPFSSLLDTEYMKAYFGDSEFSDLSFIVEDNSCPVAAVVAALRTFPSGETEISSFGRPVLYIENSKCDCGTLRRARKLSRREMERLLSLHQSSDVIYCDFLNHNQLSPISLLLLDKGATATPYFTQVMDLSKSEVELREQVRKSYKSLVNWGDRNLQMCVVDAQSVTGSHIEDFRRLHIQAANRETRSAQTWEIQHKQILANEAFLILSYTNQELVTAAFFIYNHRCCLYGVSASNRNLFDKPMSHSMLWAAILHAKKLGCQSFEMGEQLYPKQSNPVPTSKELGISRFKRGFGGATTVRLNLQIKANGK